MCTHRYRDDPALWKPASVGQQCPYPELHARLSAASGRSLLPLPMDAGGECLFHSRDLAWKRENGCAARFRELLALLAEDGTERYADFAEFVLVGEPGGAASQAGGHLLRLADLVLRPQAYFTGACFEDPVEMQRVDFAGGVDFSGVSFAADLTIRDSRFNGFSMVRARLARTWFIGVEMASYAAFTEARFGGTGTQGGGYAVLFEDVRFAKLADFSGVAFEVRDRSAVGFARVRFEDFTDFQGARFDGHTAFDEVTFAATADFVDTEFRVVGSSARYAGAAVEFTALDIPEAGVLNLQGSDPARKMFEHDVLLTFGAPPRGTIRLENVNLSRFSPSSRESLLELARQGHAEIGPGCIKYRVQTPTRTVPVDAGNASLVEELGQTFAHYVTAAGGMSLGFEVVARDAGSIRFFYFSDEDVDEAVFRDRLAGSERGLWNLLATGVQPTHARAADRDEALATVRDESAVLNAVDGLSALLGTFFRVGARIALGRWREADTHALLGAIRFNERGADARAALLHRTLAERYTGAELLYLARRQNALLPPFRDAEADGERIRILFLAADAPGRPLDLGAEISRIQASLKRARERDRLEMRPELAVTADSLMDALVELRPTIVHFAGHGEREGIVLRDEWGAPRVVSGDALAKLFAMFSDTVQCVVLSACYSEQQAREIRRHVRHVVGVRAEIANDAAVAFATGFYKAIGAGRDVPFAFELGKRAIELAGLDGAELLTRL